LIWYYSASEFNSLYTSFLGEKNIIYMTIRVNLIHSKLVFLKKIQKLNTLIKTKSSLELYKWIALFACTMQVNCTVDVNTKFYKVAMSCFVKFKFKMWNCIESTKIKLYFSITKYYICCVASNTKSTTQTNGVLPSCS
jgi:hypothetical protein